MVNGSLHLADATVAEHVSAAQLHPAVLAVWLAWVCPSAAPQLRCTAHPATCTHMQQTWGMVKSPCLVRPVQ
jgi:hypothetical protein